jgi:type II secretory pathway pseudopilin PulG
MTTIRVSGVRTLLVAGRPTVCHSGMAARGPRRQQGFSLVEFGIVLILSSLLLVTQLSQVNAAADTALSSSTGQYLAELQAAVNLYVQNFFTPLSNGQPVVYTPLTGGASYTVPNSTVPTIADLQAVHVLDAGLVAKSPDGLTFTNSITVDPGTCPGVNCVITGITYANSPLTDPVTGKPRSDLLGQAMQAAGNDSGMSMAATPGVLTGRGGSWSSTNPLGNVAGVLAIRTGDLSSLDALLAQFYKLDGSRALTGTMNANSNNIHNVNDLTANTIEANKVTLPGGPNGSLNVGANQFYGDGTNAAIRTPGQVFFQGPNGSTAANIAEVANINSSGTITAPVMNLGTPSGGCQRGQISLVNNVEYVCNQSNGWINVANMIGNVQTVQKYLGYGDGSGVSKPTCVGGSPTATIIPQTTGTNVAVDPPWETAVYQLDDQGSWWYVQISMRDPSGNWYSANSLGLTAEIDAQCQYGNE